MPEDLYLCDENGTPYNAATFDYEKYLLEKIPDPRLLDFPESRRVLTRLDPLLFALIYCRDIITSPDGNVTFADLHLELCRTARTWINPVSHRENRHAFIAARGSGKSSWVYKALPLWAGAHGHIGFMATFSSSSTQAYTHLLGLRRLMDSNQLLRNDFPDLCDPARRPNGNVISDSQEMTFRANNFCIAARGLDSGVLGLVDPLNRRPQLISLDDIEPDEANYSILQKNKRLTTIIDTIFPMNEAAHVMLVGTVTMPESIVHELAKSANSDEPVKKWIVDENFKAHYIPAIIQNPDGTERSCWPGKWSLEYLQSIRHTPSFKKNLDNRPMNLSGEYWTEEDFLYGEVDATRVMIQIDPAVTSKTTSDYTAIAIIGYQPGGMVTKDGERVEQKPMCEVRYIVGVKEPPAVLRERILRLLESYPEVGAVRIEANQGGDTWRSVFHDLPVPLLIHKETVKKQIRAQHLLNHYQRGRVLHRKSFPKLEEQMLAFPDVLNDDLIDAVGAGVQYFLAPKKKATGRTFRYGR